MYIYIERNNRYVTIPVYLHKTPVYPSPWNKVCYVMITVDRGSTSTIIVTKRQQHVILFKVLFDTIL